MRRKVKKTEKKNNSKLENKKRKDEKEGEKRKGNCRRHKGLNNRDTRYAGNITAEKSNERGLKGAGGRGEIETLGGRKPGEIAGK